MLIPFSVGAFQFFFFGFVESWTDVRGLGYAVYAWAADKSAYYNSKEVSPRSAVPSLPYLTRVRSQGHHAMAMAEGGH